MNGTIFISYRHKEITEEETAATETMAGVTVATEITVGVTVATGTMATETMAIRTIMAMATLAMATLAVNTKVWIASVTSGRSSRDVLVKRVWMPFAKDTTVGCI